MNSHDSLQLPGIEVVQDGARGSRQVVRDYMPSNELPNATLIPSSKSAGQNGSDHSGLNITGFDPHSPGKQIIDPEIDGGYEWDPRSGLNPMDKEAVLYYNKHGKPPPSHFPDNQVAPKPQETALPSTLTEQPRVAPSLMPVTSFTPEQLEALQHGAIQKEQQESITVFFHFPGTKMPYKFADVEINHEKKLLVLVSRADSRETIPEFEVTPEGQYVTLSFPNSDQIFDCSYFGQSFTVMEQWKVTVLILENVRG